MEYTLDKWLEYAKKYMFIVYSKQFAEWFFMTYKPQVVLTTKNKGWKVKLFNWNARFTLSFYPEHMDINARIIKSWDFNWNRFWINKLNKHTFFD